MSMKRHLRVGSCSPRRPEWPLNLMIRTMGGDATQERRDRLILVTNFIEELESKVGAKKQISMLRDARFRRSNQATSR